MLDPRIEPETRKMREKKQDFEWDVATHPARWPGDARPTSPREQEHTVRFAKRGLAYTNARKEQQEMEDLTSKFFKAHPK